MENRIQRFLLNASFAPAILNLAGIVALGIAFSATPSLARADDDAIKAARDDQVIEPELQRRNVKPPKIDKQNVELGAYYGILSIQDFGSNPVRGYTLAYHVTEYVFLEAEYGMSKGDKTTFEELSGSAQLLDSSDRRYTYYDLSLGWNFSPGESFILDKYSFLTNFYLIGGIGGTDFAGDSVFTVNFGAGFRMFLTDWLTFHIDARDYAFNRDILGSRSHTNNLELRTGVSVFF